MARIEVIGDSARGEEYAACRLVVDGDRIVEADAPGLRGELDGLTLLEAAAVPGDVLATDALANAIGDIFVAAPSPKRVAVAMSGGVDSAVTMLRAGRDAVGVTLRLWQDPNGPSGERVCCSPASVIAARQACHEAGIPHVTLDLREEFRERVVTPFVDDYASGLTPNPCTRCNGSFRLDALVAFVGRAGAAALWTGHYATIVERDGRRLVARGVDEAKDQSYMLATVRPELLERVAFPLGSQTKGETRAEAERAGLAAARRPESQEACFLAGGDYRAFLERQGVTSDAGPIVDADGTVLGTHDGLWRYTPGQRRGIGIASAEPLYAVRGDRSRNALVVGPRGALAVTRIETDGALYTATTRAAAKLRYRSPAISAHVRATATGFALDLDEPAFGVAPGQVAALYDDEGAVVGAGMIRALSG